MQQSSKLIKFELVFVLILVGIFVYRRFQDQKVDKDEKRENQLNYSGKNLKIFLCIIVNTFDGLFQTFLSSS